MTLAQLAQEVVERGFDYIATTRIKTFLQRAYQQLCADEPWPFLEATAEGTGTLEIADLRRILSVTDTTEGRPLEGVDRRILVDRSPDLTLTGSPEYFYLEGDSLVTYPVSASNTIRVRYLRKPAKLGDSDEPLVPEEWQYLLVDRAVVDCLKDDDELDEARKLLEIYAAGVKEMLAALVHRNLQNDQRIVRTGSTADYLG